MPVGRRSPFGHATNNGLAYRSVVNNSPPTGRSDPPFSSAVKYAGLLDASLSIHTAIGFLCVGKETSGGMVSAWPCFILPAALVEQGSWRQVNGGSSILLFLGCLVRGRASNWLYRRLGPTVLSRAPRNYVRRSTRGAEGGWKVAGQLPLEVDQLL